MDEHDARDSTITFLAEAGDGDCVGSLRLCPRGNIPLIADRLYHWGLLATRLSRDEAELVGTVGLIDRASITQSHRRSGVFTQLLFTATSVATEIGLKCLVSAIHTKNYVSLEAFQRRGFAIYDLSLHSTGSFHHLYREL